jgi:hypothetical protein
MQAAAEQVEPIGKRMLRRDIWAIWRAAFLHKQELIIETRCLEMDAWRVQRLRISVLKGWARVSKAAVAVCVYVGDLAEQMEAKGLACALRGWAEGASFQRWEREHSELAFEHFFGALAWRAVRVCTLFLIKMLHTHLRTILHTTPLRGRL